MEYIGTIRKDFYLMNYSSIVICGAGKTCERIIDFFEERKEKIKIKMICDKDEEKQGKTIKGIKVVSYDVATSEFRQALYLVANVDVLNCLKTLYSYDIKNIHIVRL